MRHKDCVFLLVSHYYVWFFAKIPQHSLANPILPATQERMLLLCLHPQCVWASVTPKERLCGGATAASSHQESRWPRVEKASRPR